MHCAQASKASNSLCHEHCLPPRINIVFGFIEPEIRALTALSVYCLQALPNKRVLIMCHENITINHYSGNNRSCLVSNCLFRVGGAACIMSNM